METYWLEAENLFKSLLPPIEFAFKGERKEIDVSDLVKSFGELTFKADFGGKRWLKWDNGVVIIDPDTKVRAGEYVLEVTMRGP